MSKKLMTLLLVAVFALAQFSMASAAVIAGDASITAIPDFANAIDVDIDWAVTGMAGPSQNILIWSRIQQDPAVDYSTCTDVATIIGTSDASGTFTYTLPATVNGDVVEFIITVDDDVCGGATYTPVAGDDPMADTVIDAFAPFFSWGKMPTLEGIGFTLTASCDTFELWALGQDFPLPMPPDYKYSGLKEWKKSTTGTFAPPVAAVGSATDLLSWPVSFPHTATGNWNFAVELEDYAGNTLGMWSLKNATVIPDELEECATFPDVAGDPNELYIRYLADIGLISGFADGSFGPDNTLTRAEAATLFEISNGYDAASLPTSAPAGCEFTDVVASDWFAGWVWQACDDGLMNGVGGGLFDPNNLLTRGQVVTILYNAAKTLPYPGNFGNPAPTYANYLNSRNMLDIWVYSTSEPILSAAWTDVPIGAYYAEPVIRTYGFGVSEGTSDTTFSPDMPVTRSVFAKWLYRALSRSY